MNDHPLFNAKRTALLTFVLGLMLLVSAFLELRSTRRELTKALHEQAQTVLSLAERGLDNAAISYSFVESLLEARLLDNARLIEKLDRLDHLTDESIVAIAQENDLYRINVFDKQGHRVLSSYPSPGQSPVNAPRRLLQPVLSDSSDELILGFRQRMFGAGENFAVAKSRQRGGAIVVNADAEEILAFRRAIGAGSFIKLIGESENVRYAVVQDSAGILLASAGVTELSAPEADPFLGTAQVERAPRTRFTSYKDEEVFEIIAPARVSESQQTFIRIGLSAASLHHATRSAFWRIGLSTLLLFMTGVLAAGVLLRDLQERRKAEEQLKRQEQISAMGHLASGVAHEIRNPLNAVSMIAQRLNREFVPEQDVDEYRQLTNTLALESRRINDIVSQFLQFARPAPLNKIPTRIDDLVRHVASLMQGEAERAGVTLHAEVLDATEIEADADKLTQALLNLVHNSLAACRAGGRIDISSSRQGERMVIRIEDNGAGIAPEHLSKIFNLYFTTREEGSGLGLSIVQQIIALHDGTIQVQSDPGKMTRFTISLPIH
jgi:signal transduction histidine kinase